MATSSRGRSKSRWPQKIRLRIRDGGKCWWCGRVVSTPKSVRDHVVPLRYGGEDNIYNMAYSCRECDQARSHDTYDEVELRLLREMIEEHVSEATEAFPNWEDAAKRRNNTPHAEHLNTPNPHCFLCNPRLSDR